jgi:hypothetical protein
VKTGILGLVCFAAFAASASAEPTVVVLTQVPCQFLESENGVDCGFTTQKKSDCEAVNRKSGGVRVHESGAMVLKAGDYIFRVTNRNVPYQLGFWLRGDGLLNRARLPGVSDGGLTTGKTQDYKVTLKPGEYVYSCPLNPTPNYKLLVEG